MNCVTDIKRWDIFNDEIFPIATFLFWEFLLLYLLIPFNFFNIFFVLIILILSGLLINTFAHILIRYKNEES